MTRREPIWSAARLNEEISRAVGASLAFTPRGEVIHFREFARQSSVVSADGKWRLEDDPAAVADVIGLKVAGIETVMSNLNGKPPLLALCALDPQAWCVVIIHPIALKSVGPFRDVSSPFREWLLRAADAGHSIGMSRVTSIGQFFRATPPDRLLVAGDPLPLVTSEGSGLFVFPLPQLVPLGDSELPTWLVEHLQRFDAGRLGCQVKSRDDAIALSAGVWQMNGCLDRSHELAQTIEGKGRHRAGDYWHAIMHRREPDYCNAKYWFRRVGQHGIHLFLARDADDILASCRSCEAVRWRSALIKKGRQEWDALAFVDLCEQVEEGHDAELSQAARQIQLIEMALLLSSTYHDAVA